MKLKKSQIYERLKTIKEISGTTDESMKNVDLSEDFDPDAYDKQMSTVFGENYYNNVEDEKPVFEDEEEGESKTKFDQYMEKDFGTQLANDQNFDKYLDEYYQLDYEDMIAGIPCRFKYTDVKPRNYNLDTVQILLATDSELKRVIPTKRLAPYREDQGEPLRRGRGRGRGAGRGRGKAGRGQHTNKHDEHPNKKQKKNDDVM